MIIQVLLRSPLCKFTTIYHEALLFSFYILLVTLYVLFLVSLLKVSSLVIPKYYLLFPQKGSNKLCADLRGYDLPYNLKLNWLASIIFISNYKIVSRIVAF